MHQRHAGIVRPLAVSRDLLLLDLKVACSTNNARVSDVLHVPCCMQSVLIIECFICKVSLLFSALYAKCPCCLVLFMQSVLILYR